MTDDDDFLLDVAIASMSKGLASVASDARLSRAEQVRRAAHVTRELRRMLAASPPQTIAARNLFAHAVVEAALTDELIELGHSLEWPNQSAIVVARRLVDELFIEGAQSWRARAQHAARTRVPVEMERLALLPLDRLDLTALRAILDAIVKFGFPFDANLPKLDLPPFVHRLREALLEAGESSTALEARLFGVRRWVAEERSAARNAQELAHSLARRLREMEREERCQLPPRVRELWLHRRAEADARGVRFDDPLDGCYRSPIVGCPEPFVHVDLDERILLVATSTLDPKNLGAELAERVVNDDVRFALDFGRPTEREGYVDYAVLLVTGSDCGTPFFLRQECSTSDDWLL